MSALSRSRAAGLLGAVAAACTLPGCLGYTEIRTQCPDCTVVSRHRVTAPVARDARTLYLLVPGILGFGWEWDEPIATLRSAPEADVQVFDWRPSSSLGRVATDLASTINALWRESPETLERVVILGHSAGGIVTAHAAAQFQAPAGREILVVNVGTPYAGMGIMGVGPTDFVWAPFITAVGMCMHDYPPPAAGVTVESWVTSPKTDPVMKQRFGHRPDDPAIGPPGRRIPLPAEADHNGFLVDVVRDVLGRYGAAESAERHSRRAR